MRSLLVGLFLLCIALTGSIIAAEKVELSVDASKTGAKIDRLRLNPRISERMSTVRSLSSHWTWKG